MEELITSFVESNNIMAHSEYPGMTITRYCWGIFHSCLDRLLYNSVKDYLFLHTVSESKVNMKKRLLIRDVVTEVHYAKIGAFHKFIQR